MRYISMQRGLRPTKKEQFTHFPCYLKSGAKRYLSDMATNQLGMGIDTALPAPCSAIQRVSPAGSTPVGVLSPSLITVMLALSPLTVITEILPLPFSATKSLPFAARKIALPCHRSEVPIG